MTRKNKFLSLLLAGAVAVSGFAFPALAEEAPMEAMTGMAEDYLGEELPDFSVETLDGETFTLSETLKEKKGVLINLWATWCGPCASEFPYLEAAYEQYSDEISVIALSVEEEDTPEKLTDYAKEHGMTFDIGSDTGIGLGNIFATEGIPTSVVVDRFGKVVLVEVGSQPSVDPFLNLFEYLSSEDYTESVILDAFPPTKPNVEPADPAELAEYLNGEDTEIVWSNPTDPMVWPMVPVHLLLGGEAGMEETEAMEAESEDAMMESEAMDAESEDAMMESETMEAESTDAMMESEAMEAESKDAMMESETMEEEAEEPAADASLLTAVEAPARYVTSSNSHREDSTASITGTFNSAAGDVLAFDFRTTTEAGCDLFTISLDGSIVKTFGGEHGWSTYALEMPGDGEHTIAFSYLKDYTTSYEEDQIWFGNVRLLSGEEAVAALAANPAYPTAEEISFTVQNENAKEIVFTGDEEDLEPLIFYFDAQKAYIVNDETVKVRAMVDDTIDPESAFFFNNYDGTQFSLIEGLDGEGYSYESGLDDVAVTGYPYTNVYLYLSSITYDYRSFLLFANEENANAFVESLAEEGLEVAWTYADGTDPSTTAAATPAADNGMAEYTVIFQDQNGDPVPGCIVNFCTDEACTPVVADDAGTAVFTGEPYEYHLQVIKVPEGYSFDTEQEFYTEAESSEIRFEVTKN